VIDTTAIKQKAILEEQARVKAEADAKALNDERAKLEAERNRLAATRRRISSGSGSSSDHQVPFQTPMWEQVRMPR
jgi:hypothetical protein